MSARWQRRTAPADHGGPAVRRESRRHAACWPRSTRSGCLVRPGRSTRRPSRMRRRIPKPPESPEWSEIRDKALEALAKSKDLRLLAHLGTAVLRTDGVPAFSETLSVASQWLETYWSQTYPLVDEDADPPAKRAELLRRSDGGRGRAPPRAARQQPSARHVQPSRHRHRDASAGAGRRRRRRWTRTRSTRRLRRCRWPSSRGSTKASSSAVASLKKIDATMREAAGSDATPSFDPLTAQLARMSQVLRAQLALHPDALRRPASGVEAPQPPLAATGFGERRRQVAAGCHPGVGRGGGFLSGAPSRRVRSRCFWSVRSVWSRRIFSKCWPTSPRTRSRRHGRQAG